MTYRDLVKDFVEDIAFVQRHAEETFFEVAYTASEDIGKGEEATSHSVESKYMYRWEDLDEKTKK